MFLVFLVHLAGISCMCCYQGNCLGAVAYRSKFEALVTELGCQFIRRDIYVPSFHEMYPFDHSLCDGTDSRINVIIITG